MDFDEIIDRRNTQATKWRTYDKDVLPFWVADIDVKSPPGVIEAMQQRIRHGVFGYETSPYELKEEIVAWLKKQHSWSIDCDSIIFLPGVVPGFNWAVRQFLTPMDGLLIQTPVYSHILHAASACGVQNRISPLQKDEKNYYRINFEDFKKQLEENVKMFLLCNPHNPVGRVYHQKELEIIAELCMRNDTLICSDEIHADLVFSGHKHIPIASLSPEIAACTISLFAPSKTFNIAGLKCAYAVIPNPKLRRQFINKMGELLGGVNILGYTAALAAYKTGKSWLEKLLVHLQNNLDILTSYLNQYIPQIRVTPTEGTYLAWLDCNQLSLPQNPYAFFLEEARVALTDGKDFGDNGENFVRLNFGCPQSILLEGLERMKNAISRI